jgi:beta-carotene ketolase (CrtO type)
LRMMMSSPLDIVNEWFESDQVKMQILALAHGSLSSPMEKGTGHYAAGLGIMQMAGKERDQGDQKIDTGLLGVSVPVGGVWELARALQDCIKDFGGTILTSTVVKKIIVENGVAKGVVLASGEQILANKAVVSNAHVKQLFLEMLEPDVLPAGFREKVSRLRHGTSRGTITLFLALNEAPRYKVGGDVDKAHYFYMYPLLKEFLEIHERYEKGIPTTRCLHNYIPTLVDPSRAPAGKHVMRILNLSPYELEDGSPAGWEKIKDKVGQGMLDNFRTHATNMGDSNIIARRVISPEDYRIFDPAFYLGDTMHLSMNLSQLFGNRPLPGWNYRTPVKKLYMCGASTHPGGTLTGASGRIAAQLAMEDLGIDFKKVATK